MNKTSEYKFTIIVPVFNEEDNMERIEKTLCEYMAKSSVKACTLFVNDGSTDNSQACIDVICQRHDNCFSIKFKKNVGLSGAIKAGIDVAESELVGYIDADLQTDPNDFEKLLPFTADYKLVTGIRAKRKDSAFKLMQSKIANGFRRMMTGDGATDTGCPLKIMHSDYAKRIPFFTGMHRFLPALILLQEGGNFYETQVSHFPRIAGVSKYNLWNRLISPFKDCFAYRWMKHRYINYNIEEANL